MPKPHKYTDWGLQRLHQQTPIYIAENNRVEAGRVVRDKKTIVIKHDKTKQ
jgi:hypothetical protein